MGRMIDSPNVKYSAAILIALIGGSCTPVSRAHPSASRDTNAPITEGMYREAARHCHSKTVVRMRRGVLNTFNVGGLMDSRGRASGDGDAKRIECVRQYLGIPDKDVIVVFS